MIMLAVVALGAIAIMVVIGKRQADEYRDQLRIEQHRREQAEHAIQGKAAEMDGALEKIHELNERVNKLAPEH